jgi:hypothetical protein
MKRGVIFYTIVGIAVMSVAGLPPMLAMAESLPTFQQTPIKLQASKVLAKDLLRGDNYTVNESVENDGLVNIYMLEPGEDEIRVETTALLLIRISELRALKVLEEMSGSEEFMKGVGEAVVAPVKGAAAMVTAPVETTKGIVKGTGRFFSNVGRSITSKDPHQENVVGAALGYDATKRAYAFEFGVDPYTSFEPLANRLGTIAKSSVAGGLTVAVGMEVAVGTDSTFGMVLFIASTAEGMRQLAADNPPGALQKINRKKLEELGIKGELIKAYLSNYAYNPQEMTMFVGELETMKGVKDMDTFVSIATLASDESLALYYRLTAQLMAGYHNHVAPAVRIVNLTGEPALQTKDGKVVLLAEVDYVFWTQAVADVLNGVESDVAKIADVSGKEVWISGKMDDAARKVWESRGWKIVQDANKKIFKK